VEIPRDPDQRKYDVVPSMHTWLAVAAFRVSNVRWLRKGR